MSCLIIACFAYFIFSKEFDRNSGFILPDGTYIHEERRDVDLGKMKGLFVFVHGLGAHCLRYEELSKFLNERGYAVFLYDVRGMGSSDPQEKEKKIQIDDFQQYADDLEYILKNRIENHGKPIFIAGESLGTVQIHLLDVTKGLQNVNPDIKGFVSIATAIHLIGISKILEWVSYYTLPFLSYIFPDMILVDPDIKIEKLTRIKREQDKCLSDELHIFQGAKNKWAYAFMRNYYFMIDNLQQMKIPVVYVHTEGDEFIPASALSKNIYRRSGSGDKTMVFYKEMKHDMIHDYGKERMFFDILRWIGERNELDDSVYEFDGVEELLPPIKDDNNREEETDVVEL